MEQPADDSITALPQPLIEHIFSFIPFKDLTRTSVLSRRWRYLWTSAPHMSFDERGFRSSHPRWNPFNLLFLHSSDWFVERARREAQAKELFIRMVNRCLSLSTDALTSAHILFSVSHRSHATTLDRWVRSLLNKRRVQELDLDLDLSRSFHPEIPRSLLKRRPHGQPSSLRTIHLRNLSLWANSLSLMLENLVHLENLTAENCKLEAGERVIIRSQQSPLKNLSVNRTNSSTGWRKVQIDLPNLVVFEYRGCFVDFDHLNLRSLSRAVFGFHGLNGWLMPRLRKAVAAIQHVKSLQLCATSVRVIGDIERSRTSEDFLLGNLEELVVDIETTQGGLWFLLVRCPNLQTLTIRGSNGESSRDTPARGALELPALAVPRLTSLKVEDFGGREGEHRMMEILLKEASALEVVKIKVANGRSYFEKLAIMRRFLLLGREFQKARILVSL
ncbi:F-box/LRR-repeat protein At3g58900-like [Nymphaea colorata]|uniref:F-box/LRR-repeat protein At3g58900-like n=1 Tax=Nymphaea colorata TaxID=210225 RepID=UPI00129DFF68|nr:F-box/LRR-repeat protein At3g58900-like [Nymphaea colorata]